MNDLQPADPDRPPPGDYRFTLTVKGVTTTHGPYKDADQAARAARMWARRAMRYGDDGVFTAQVQRAEWTDVGAPINDWEHERPA